MKGILYNAVIPRWNTWTNDFPLQIDDIIMRDKNWVELVPMVPDRDIIFKHFLSGRGKKGPTFKSGKTVIQFHVPNEIHAAMLEKRDTDELAELESEVREKKAMTESRDVGSESSVTAEFTVSAYTCP